MKKTAKTKQQLLAEIAELRERLQESGTHRDGSEQKRFEEALEQSRNESEEALRERTLELQQLIHTLEMQVRESTAELKAEIEERKRAEEALRESEKELRYLSFRLLIVQEKERRQIAQDLHDHIWQILNAIRLDIDLFLSQQAARSLTTAGQSARRIVSNIGNAIERIRRMQGDLWPSVLDDIGILATISWYCREFERNHPGISIEKQIEVTEEEVPAGAKIVIYRAMQEALKNVAQHSHATHVLVTLKKEEERVQFEINDNGQGFDLEQILFRTRPLSGFGLVGMRQRIEHSGGTFEVRSENGMGTTLQASWPLRETALETLAPKPIKRTSTEPEDSFRTVTEAISDWVYAFRVEPDGKFVYDWITPGFTMVTGYRPDELRDEADLERILHPEDRPIAEERLRYIKALRPHVSEHRMITKKGDSCWIRDYINPVADPLHPGTIKVIGAAQNITEHKEAEQALRESQKDLNRAQAVAQMGSWRLDVRRNELLWSDQTHRLFGIPKGTPLTYEAFLATVHPEDRHFVDQSWQAALRGEPYSIEHRILADGNLKWVRERAELEFDGQGVLLGGFGTVQDITERKQGEAALLRAKQEWERTFDSVPDLVAILDTEHRIIRANRAMAERLGLRPEQCVGQNCFKCVHDSSSPPESCPHIQTMRDGQQHVAEVHEDHLGGDFLVSTTPMFDEEGQMMGTVHVARDITARKRTEETLRKAYDELESRVQERTAELKKTMEALEAERHRFNAVLETLPAYLVLLTPDYHVAFANRFFREHFGDSCGRRCFEYLFGRANPCENCETYSVLKTMGPHEWEWVGPDGRNYYIYDFPFTDADGSTFILEMGIDVTERKRAEQQLKESGKQLRSLSSELLRAQERERRRIAGELHDSVAASLSAIKFSIEKIFEKRDQDERTRVESSDIISRVQQIIEETRRIMSDLRPSVLDDLGIVPAINWLCREFQKTYSGISIEKQIDLREKEIPDSLKTPIFRIVQEALNNVAKHSKATSVNLALQKSDRMIELKIRDNGQGFDVEAKALTEDSRHGLGLIGMRERSELSGGSFAIDSEKGLGTAIRVMWPQGKE